MPYLSPLIHKRDAMASWSRRRRRRWILKWGLICWLVLSAVLLFVKFVVLEQWFL